MSSADTDIVCAADNLDFLCACNRCFFYLVYILTKRYFMSCFCPYCISFQMEGYGYGIFARTLLFCNRKIIGFFA